MKKVVKSAAILAAAVVCFTGCQKMQEEETVRTQVGIALYNEKDVFLRSIIKNVFELTRDSDEPFENLELEMQDAAADQILQNSQIKRFVDIKCQVLCANLVDRTSAGNIVSAAKDADIPVIFLNANRLNRISNATKKLIILDLMQKILQDFRHRLYWMSGKKTLLCLMPTGMASSLM